MKSFYLYTLFLCLITVAACEKDKLDGETSILTGKWNWTESYEVANHCYHDSLWTYKLIDSAGTNKNRFSLEFLEKGKVIFYHNDGILWKKRLVFEAKNMLSNDLYEYHFVIRLNNNSNDKMDVWVGQDSLLLNDFPKDTDATCYEIFNHFIRE